MSTVAAWFRRNFGWSNSPRAWTERLAGLALITGVVWAIWFGRRLPAVHQLLIWAALVLATAILLRRGWFMLFGPVLFYDMVRNSRRSHFVWIRCLYAALLLFFLATYFLGRSTYDLQNRYTMGSAAEEFFETFLIVQLIAVGLLTPAYVAGSIAEEKEKKTLEFLLATDLRNREIVLSKLGSRLANLLIFLLTGLPIVCLLQFVGGVDPDLVLAGFAATGVTALSLAGASIFASTHMKRPRDAIAVTYMLIIAYFVLSLLALGSKFWFPIVMSANLGTQSYPITLSDVADAFGKGNVIVLVALGRFGGSLARTLPGALPEYALFHGIVALILITWGVLRLRAVALKQAGGPARRSPTLLRLGRRPRIGIYPMLWKELHAEGSRPNLIVLAILVLLIGLTLFSLAIMLYFDLLDYYRYRSPWNSIALHANMWVRTAGTIVACLTLLSVAVRASTAISSERDRQTFDALLTTPMDSTPMLFAKWLGSLCSVRVGWLWLASIWGVGIVTGGLDWIALIFLVPAWLIYASFLATLGLWFSLVCSSSLRATVLTILVALGVSVGHWLPWMCCVPLGMRFERSLEYLAKFQAGLTPPAALGFLQFSTEEFNRPYGASREMAEFIGFSVFGLFLWAAATGILWSVLNMRFRIVTKRGARLRSEQPYAPPRPRPPRWDRSDEPARRPSGAVLLEEVWDDEDEPRKR
jgi:ABC-type transport system involved in multi-copper enzyme maturation permease subunit